MKESKQKLIVILGPTASGKTALAEYLASVFDGELINADSRQIYRDMNIGTAKTPDIHLIDIKNPNQSFSVAQYKKLAINIINDIIKRKKIPILAGGTGLYIKAVIKNLNIPLVPAQKNLRRDLEKQSTEELFNQLQKCDPKGALHIDRHNKRRLIRALEVTLASNSAFSVQAKKQSPLFEYIQIGMDVKKEDLLLRIRKRTSDMIENGLEKEVCTLVGKYGWTNILLTTIGYKEWQRFFEGKITREDVYEKIIGNSKKYVKKQYTWFNADKTIKWIKGKDEAVGLVKKFCTDSKN